MVRPRARSRTAAAPLAGTEKTLTRVAPLRSPERVKQIKTPHLPAGFGVVHKPQVPSPEGASSRDRYGCRQRHGFPSGGAPAMNNSIFLGWLCSASSASRVHVRATSMRMACTLAFGARSTICRQSAARCLHSLGVIIVRPRAVFCDVQGSADACAYSSQRLQFRSRVAARSRREALFCRSRSPRPKKSPSLRKLLSGAACSEPKTRSSAAVPLELRRSGLRRSS